MASLNTDNRFALQVMFEPEDLYLIGEQAVVPAPAQAIPPPEKAGSGEPVATAASEEPVFDYLGENNGYFLVLTSDPGHDYLNDTELDLLQKTLSRKGIELRDTAILNILRHQGSDFGQLKAYFSCSRLVLFGINPAVIGLKGIALNQAAETDGVKILATYSFAEMKDHTGKKTEFWNSMKSF